MILVAIIGSFWTIRYLIAFIFLAVIISIGVTSSIKNNAEKMKREAEEILSHRKDMVEAEIDKAIKQSVTAEKKIAVCGIISLITKIIIVVMIFVCLGIAISALTSLSNIFSH